MFVLKSTMDRKIADLQSQIDELNKRLNEKPDKSELDFVIEPGRADFAWWRFSWIGRKTCRMQEAIELLAKHVGVVFDVEPEAPARAVLKSTSPRKR